MFLCLSVSVFPEDHDQEKTSESVITETGKDKDPSTEEMKKKAEAVKKKNKKDKIFLMGLVMLRLNWTGVKGDDLRFRYSDMGLPADFSTRERASLMVDGTFGDGFAKVGNDCKSRSQHHKASRWQ